MVHHTAQQLPSQITMGKKRLPQIQETANRFLVSAGRVACTCPFFPTKVGPLSQRKVSIKGLFFADKLDIEIQSSFLMEHFF